MPKVSVIMSCYRESEPHLRQAVESILNQTFTDFEFIIVLDDPNNERMLSILQEYEVGDKRIQLIVQDSNKGLAVGRNTGIAAARGEYVAMMDADDSAHSDRLKQQLEWINTHSCDLVFTHMDFINDEGKHIGVFEPRFDSSRNIFIYLFKSPVFAHPTVLGRRDVFVQNHYDPSFRRGQDVELWVRLALGNYRFCVLPEKLLEYRLHKSSYIERIIRQRGYVYHGLRLVRKHMSSFWRHPIFWLYALKRVGYFVVMWGMPKGVLVGLMKIKDRICL